MKDVMAEIQDKLTEYISTIIQQESLRIFLFIPAESWSMNPAISLRDIS